MVTDRDRPTENNFPFRWGYKVPDFPNDKCFRACYRAAAAKCLMRDISYHPCIQIEGPVDEILSKLSALAAGFGGRGEEEDDVLGGRVERKAFVYRSRKRPLGVVGEVSYLWRPPQPGGDDGGCLWVFCHPSLYDDLKEEIVSSVFCCERERDQNGSENEEAPPPKRRKKDVGAAKLATRNVPFDRAPKYRSSTGAVTVTLLQDTINRFRLVGPESGAVLAAALRRTALDTKSDGTKWWEREGERAPVAETFSAQWEALETTLGKARPAEMKAGSVFAVTVRDPRAVLPKNRGAVKKEPRKPGRYKDIRLDYMYKSTRTCNMLNVCTHSNSKCCQ